MSWMPSSSGLPVSHTQLFSNARSLAQHLLCLRCSRAAEHPWLSGAAPSDRPLSRAVSGLKPFNAKRKFQQAVRTVILGRKLAVAFGFGKEGLRREQLIDGRMALDFGQSHTLADTKQLMVALWEAADELHGISPRHSGGGGGGGGGGGSSSNGGGTGDGSVAVASTPTAGSNEGDRRPRSVTGDNSIGGYNGSSRTTGRRASLAGSLEPGSFSPTSTDGAVAGSPGDSSAGSSSHLSSPHLQGNGGSQSTSSTSGRRRSSVEGGLASPMVAAVGHHHQRNSHRHIIPIETFAEVLDETLNLDGDDTMIHAHLEVFATGFLRRWVDYVAYVVGLSTMFGTSTDDKLGCAFDVLDTDHDGVLDLHSTEVELLLDSVLGFVGHDTKSEVGLLHDLCVYRGGLGRRPRPDEPCLMTKGEFVEACKAIPQLLHYFISLASLAAHVQSVDGAAHSSAFASSLGKFAHTASVTHEQHLRQQQEQQEQEQEQQEEPGLRSLPNSMDGAADEAPVSAVRTLPGTGSVDALADQAGPGGSVRDDATPCKKLSFVSGEDSPSWVTLVGVIYRQLREDWAPPALLFLSTHT